MGEVMEEAFGDMVRAVEAGDMETAKDIWSRANGEHYGRGYKWGYENGTQYVLDTLHAQVNALVK